MELQTSESHLPTETSSSEPRPDHTSRPSQEEELSASFPAFRFPRPQGNQRLANWISNSSPDIRQLPNMSDTGSLADSAYEMINGTDTESQDDRMTASTCSLSVSRPDDVHSLDGSEAHYNTDSDEESNHSSHASSIRYADQTLQNPSTQLPTASLDHGSSTEGSGVVVRSIEFQETDGDDPVLLESISAAHVIREFSEEESTVIAHELKLHRTPNRLVVLIRQTMSQSYLSTQGPLRVLYVGHAEAQRGIVLKICSAIWASPKSGSNEQESCSRHNEGVYNIVPISSFGPAPELDLMEASEHQIKVEHCTSAEIIQERDPALDDVAYCITIDQERTYRSCFSAAGGPEVQPNWELPHIAVFYCSEQDDIEAKTTRDAAWWFMHRHGVPSMFISDQQKFFESDVEDYIDDNALHLCLESRDPEKPFTPRCFPIDLESFADIDARQMNRNLAYLVGLSQQENATSEEDAEQLSALTPKVLTLLGGWKQFRTTSVDQQELVRSVRILVRLLLLLLVVPFFVLPYFRVLQPETAAPLHASSSTGVCVSSPTYPAGFTTSKSAAVTTSTKTVVINVTSTQTVQVSQAKPSTSTLASVLSFAGFLSDAPSAVPADTEAKKSTDSSKKTFCSVQLYSPTELLVAIPSRNKAVWLANGAIDIAVRRNDDIIKTKLSSADEGVLVELASKDAYGTLNVSVVTARKPKINETFQVDFGRNAVVEAFEAGLHLLQYAVNNLPFTDEAAQFAEKARKASHKAASDFEHMSEAVRGRAAGTVKRAKDNAREHLARQLKSAEEVRKEVELSVLQGQIASRLWWLKMQGRMDEYNEYQRNASRLLKMKHAELDDGRKGKGQGKGQGKNFSPKEAKKSCGFRSGLYTPWKKDCAAGRDERVKSSGSRDDRRVNNNNPWKKLMGGM